MTPVLSIRSPIAARAAVGGRGPTIESLSLEYAGDLLTHVHVADSFDHRASSGLRYIVNPPGSTARVHQRARVLALHARGDRPLHAGLETPAA